MAPDQYRDQLAVLQNGVPPKSPAEVRRIIVEGLGRPIAQLFNPSPSPIIPNPQP